MPAIQPRWTSPRDGEPDDQALGYGHRPRGLHALGTPAACVAAFTPDGYRIVSGSVDGTARVWDATPLIKRLCGEDAPELTYLGKAAGWQGPADEAIASFRQAIELNPKLAAPHEPWYRSLRCQRDYDGAIACFRRLSKATEVHNAHYNLGIAL